VASAICSWGNREVIERAIADTRRLQSGRKLTQEVGDALLGITPSYIDYPLAKHRRVDQRVDPNRVSDSGAPIHQIDQFLLRDRRDRAAAERLHIVISDLRR